MILQDGFQSLGGANVVTLQEYTHFAHEVLLAGTSGGYSLLLEHPADGRGGDTPGLGQPLDRPGFIVVLPDQGLFLVSSESFDSHDYPIGCIWYENLKFGDLVYRITCFLKPVKSY